MNKDPIVIASATRSAIANFQGAFSQTPAAHLGGHVIRSALDQIELNGGDVNEILMGCVLPAGQGQAPARQAARNAGLPLQVGATTINKMCGSGMKAVMLAHDMLLARETGVMVAGGMENMTMAPYLLPKARQGLRLGHGQCLDHMFLDGLEDAYNPGKLMGVFADETANEYQITREDQDKYAINSVERAQQAQKNKCFISEITPITIASKKSELIVAADEGPQTARPDKIPQLKPAFGAEGTVTAANASSISDGAAALVLMRHSTAVKRGITPLATIAGHASHAHEPERFTTAPAHAIKKLLVDIGWQTGMVDLYEINEAFAVVTLAAIKDLELPLEKVNIHGGACVLGHPIGATGARIIVSLIYALRHYNLKRGVAALCIGGGEATAIAIEITGDR